MGVNWIESAETSLLRLRNNDAGWGYYSGGASFTEPTVICSLALLAGRCSGNDEAVTEAARWLAEIQHPDGWVGVGTCPSTVAWPTPYAIVLWTNLKGFDSEIKRARSWLLTQKGQRLPKMGVFGHDVTLEGWPWISGTHSWLEPTAWAVMALRRSHFPHHPRTEEGIKLIQDRAIESGGWNYGNKTVFGHDLRPQPAPTGLAMLALAHLKSHRESLTSSPKYLREVLQKIRSPISLSWGILGLTAWGTRPEKSFDWLTESFLKLGEETKLTLSLGSLLLAAHEHSFRLLTTTG